VSEGRGGIKDRPLPTDPFDPARLSCAETVVVVCALLRPLLGQWRACEVILSDFDETVSALRITALPELHGCVVPSVGDKAEEPGACHDGAPKAVPRKLTSATAFRVVVCQALTLIIKQSSHFYKDNSRQ
jgi:hypothetical protein